MADLSKLMAPKKVRLRVQTPRRVVRDTPVHRFVDEINRSTGINYRTTAEVAETLGVSTQWIRKVQRLHLLGVPSRAVQFGRMQIYLYTPEDVEKIRTYLADRQEVYANPGHPVGRVESWEEVIKRRERAEENAHLADGGDPAEAGAR
jgi:hypothetical protein